MSTFQLLRSTRVPPSAPYQVAFAVAVTTAASAISIGLSEATDVITFSVFLGAVVICAWFGGTLSASLCAIASLPVLMLLTPPRWEVSINDSDDDVRLAAFAIVSVMIIALDMVRRRAERQDQESQLALREQDESLRLAMNAGRMGAWQWNVREQTIRWSAELEAMLGRTGDGFEGTIVQFLEMVHPEDREQLQLGVTKSLTGGAPHVELEYRMPVDGASRWFAANGRVIRDETGYPGTLIGVAWDTTERRLAEQHREREAAFHSEVLLAVNDTTSIAAMLQRCTEAMTGLLDAAFARAWTLAEGGDILELQASAGLYKHLNGEHARIRVGEFKIGRIAQERRPHLTNSVIGDERVHDQEWAEREGMVSFAGYPLVSGGRVLGVLAMFGRRPLSPRTLSALAQVAEVVALGIDRRLSDQVTRNSEERYRQLAALLPIALYTCDPEGRLTYFNEKAVELWGREPHLHSEEDRFCGSFKLWRTDGLLLPHAETPMAAALNDGLPFRDAEASIERPDGSRIWVRISGEVLEDEYGRRTGAISVFSDITAAHEAGVAIRASEERFRSLSESITSIVWTTDANGEFVEEQPAWSEYTGQTWEQLRGFGWAEAIHEEDRASVQERWATARDTVTPYFSSGRLWHAPSGEYRHFEARAVPIQSAGRAIKEWVGNVVDVHEQRQAELTLVSLKDQLAADLVAMQSLHGLTVRLVETETLDELLQRVLDAAIHLMGSDKGLVQLRDPQTKVLAVAAQTGFGTRFLEAFAEISTVDETSCARSLRSGSRTIIPDVYADPLFAPFMDIVAESGFRSVQSTPLVGPSGEILGMLSTYRSDPHTPSERDLRLMDLYAAHAARVIERAQTEAAVRESEERFRTMANTAPVLIWTAGVDQLLTWFNKPWLDFTGRTLEQEIGDGWQETVHPDDLQQCLDSYTASFGAREEFEIEYRLRRHDGEYHWVVDRGVPRYGPFGAFAGYIGSCVDVHERKEVEIQLRRANEAKDEFLGMVSHELRTPVTTMYSGARYLLSRFDQTDDETKRDVLKDVEQESQRLQLIIENLLALAREETGQTAEPEPVSVDRTVQKAIRRLAKLRPTRHVSFEPGATSTFARSVPIYLELVMRNVMDNADKYSPPGQPIEVFSHADNGYVRISVRDYGPGISDDEQEKIWERFYRSQNVPAQSSGAGIGLSVCKRLMESQGGSIDTRNAEGGGLEVTMTLPAYQE